jgi:mono/diheme cytochrome c family protein
MKKLPITVLLAMAGSVAFVAAGQALTAAPQPAQIAPGIIAPDGYIQFAQAAGDPPPAAVMTLGADLFDDNCAGCHGGEGQGVVGPALAANEFLASASAIAEIILAGTDPGHAYMPAFAALLDNEEVAAIGTFVRNSWGNSFGLMLAEQVAVMRAAAGGGGGGE